MRPIDHLMDRLAELAAGAEPTSRVHGICENLNLEFPDFPHYGHPEFLLDKCFLHMRLWTVDPLGDVWDEGDHWSGRRGQRRRKLCYDLLVQFVASAGYRGRYQ